MLSVEYLSMSELEAGMEYIRQAPKDDGTLKMIARRPQEDERDLLDQGELSLTEGLVGDNWKGRGSKHTPDGSATLYSQITVMNARCTALLAQSEAALARGAGIGRNDPCPCGSARRYKQCHGAVGAPPASPEALISSALAAHRQGDLGRALTPPV